MVAAESAESAELLNSVDAAESPNPAESPIPMDISFAASNNYEVTTAGGSMTLTSGADYTLVASNNVNFTATTTNINMANGDSILGTAQGV
eukprot:jgi/Tetstr1/454847/TSEL_000325.t1